MIRIGSAPWATQESSKESLCSSLITTALNQNVDHMAILTHGTPEILLLAVDAKTSSKWQWSPSRPSRRFNFRA
jgi:hypothetical protein